MSETKRDFFKKGVICILGLALLLTQASALKLDLGKGENKTFSLSDTSVVETASSRHAQPEPAAAAVQNLLGTAGFEKKMENARLEIWFRSDTNGVRIVDKKSGYVWGGLPADKVAGMNQKWSGIANSLCTVEYFDQNTDARQISIADESVNTSFDWSGNEMTCTVNLTEEEISFAFHMKLLDDSLQFSMDENTIHEGKTDKLKSVYFVPFLGCTKEDEVSGYMFVPDGPGALIRYEKAASYVSGFEKKMYGKDMGVDELSEASDLMANRTNDYLTDVPQATIPVYGVVHGAGRNAFMAVIENGTEYASVVASVSGIVTDYNWVAARFDFRQTYIQPTSKDGEGIKEVQGDINKMAPQIRFYFLTGSDADYSGMAVKYRGMLEAQGLLGSERVDADIPMRLDVVGADVKKGFLFKTRQLMTTAAQAQGFVSELAGDGIRNLTMVYEGWQKGGINGTRYGQLGFNKQVGSLSDFERLRDTVTKAGGRFYLGLNPITANKDQINLSASAATTMSKQFEEFVRPNTSVMYNENYVVKPTGAASYVSQALQTFSGFNFDFTQMGYRLYADFTRGKNVTRAQSESLFRTALAGRAKGRVALSNPNQFLWGMESDFFDIPTVNSQYLFETDTVPFLQIVLKGHVDYYAPYANQGFYSEEDVLKMIEYGMYPSFIGMAADNYALHDTPLEDYFSINFGDWEDTMQQVYKQVDAALKNVEGRQITEHKVLAQGVVRVIYEGPVSIYVNYNAKPYVAGSVTVPAYGYLVERG